MNAPSASSAPDFVARERELFKKSGITSLDVRYVSNETELFLLFAQFMHRWDPDILVGMHDLRFRLDVLNTRENNE